MSYTLQEFLDDRNESLYQEVSAISNFTFQELDAGEAWGVRYDASTKLAEVIYSMCAHPVAAFTHELLHVKFEINGYQKPEQTFKPTMWPDDQYRARVNAFRSYAYNHLMHFKMYPEFVALGFPSEQFLLESNAAEQSQEVLEKCKTDLNDSGNAKERGVVATEEFIAAFFVLSKPSANTGEQTWWQKSLQKLDPLAYGELDRFLRSWRESENADIRWHLARLFYMCGHHDVGIGYHGSIPIWASECKTAK